MTTAEKIEVINEALKEVGHACRMLYIMADALRYCRPGARQFVKDFHLGVQIIADACEEQADLLGTDVYKGLSDAAEALRGASSENPLYLAAVAGEDMERVHERLFLMAEAISYHAIKAGYTDDGTTGETVILQDLAERIGHAGVMTQRLGEQPLPVAA